MTWHFSHAFSRVPQLALDRESPSCYRGPSAPARRERDTLGCSARCSTALDSAPPITLEQLNIRLENIWSLVDEAKISHARIIAEQLAQDASQQRPSDNIESLHYQE